MLGGQGTYLNTQRAPQAARTCGANSLDRREMHWGMSYILHLSSFWGICQYECGKGPRVTKTESFSASLLIRGHKTRNWELPRKPGLQGPRYQKMEVGLIFCRIFHLEAFADSAAGPTKDAEDKQKVSSWESKNLSKVFTNITMP